MDRDYICGVLLRCIIWSFALLLLWLGALLVASDFVLGIHSRMFGIDRNDLLLIHYCAMGLFKLLVFVTFVIPYLAIRFGPKEQA